MQSGILEQNSPVLTGKVQYVLHVDGGSLLQWTMNTGTTDREIQVCTVYTENVKKKYGEPIMVFDGNGESSSKDMVHQRLAKGQAAVINVTFNQDMKLCMKKAYFSSKQC